jgi:hypothetical protein
MKKWLWENEHLKPRTAMLLTHVEMSDCACNQARINWSIRQTPVTPATWLNRTWGSSFESEKIRCLNNNRKLIILNSVVKANHQILGEHRICIWDEVRAHITMISSRIDIYPSFRLLAPYNNSSLEIRINRLIRPGSLRTSRQDNRP